jgi:HrpA-like RNA helicase
VGSKRSGFHLYRYQILPITQDFPFQTQFDPTITSLSDLTDKKNYFFLRALKEIEEFTHYRNKLIHKKHIDEDNNIIMIRLGVNRSITLSRRDFTEEELENWPTIVIFVNNSPSVQIVAIQIDYKVFYRTNTVVHILEDSINPILRRYQLKAHFSAIYDKNEFWELVDKYQNKIIEAKFEMISPNMSNISQSLRLDLDELHRRTNTQETQLKLKSDKSASLVLPRYDKFIESLVEYSSLGGGNITLKIVGLKKNIKTQSTVKEISMDALLISGSDPQQLIDIARDILK